MAEIDRDEACSCFDEPSRDERMLTPDGLPVTPSHFGWLFFDVERVLRLTSENHFDGLLLIRVKGIHRTVLVDFAPEAIELFREAAAIVDAFLIESQRKTEAIAAGHPPGVAA